MTFIFNLLRSPFSRPTVALQAAHADTLPSLLHFKHIILWHIYWSCISSTSFYGTSFYGTFLYWKLHLLKVASIEVTCVNWITLKLHHLTAHFYIVSCILSTFSNVAYFLAQLLKLHFEHIYLFIATPAQKWHALLSHCVINSSYLWPFHAQWPKMPYNIVRLP